MGLRTDYEWQYNTHKTYPNGTYDIVDLDHSDTLDGFQDDPKTMKSNIERCTHSLDLKIWKTEVDSDGAEDAADFDYVYMDYSLTLNKWSGNYGWDVPKRFQKELDRIFKGGE